MSLKKPTGNMYPFIDGIWNPVRGKCRHGCKYCYVIRSAKRYNRKQSKIRLDDKELNTNLHGNKYIFVCSGCDLFAADVPLEFINAVIYASQQYDDNKYLLQTKNPERIFTSYIGLSANLHVVCTTIETNRNLPRIMNKSPHVIERAFALRKLAQRGIETMVTIEPIIDFDLEEMVKLIKMTCAKQVNIGADSGGNKLPEPSKEKVIALISELEKFTVVYQKKNLRRLIK